MAVRIASESPPESPPEPPSERRRLLSYKTLVQVGGGAAAVASVLGLALTIGDRTFGLFESDAPPGPHLEEVRLETMPLGAYYVAKKGPGSLEGLRYTKAELDSNELVVNFDARFEGSTKAVAYPVRLTLLTRDSSGKVHVGEPRQDNYTMDKSDDHCGCSDVFVVHPRHGESYQVLAQILSPNGTAVLQDRPSAWYRA
jgi:hypothetical protein